MKISISNIAWEPAEDQAVIDVLSDYSITSIEIAPTKWWPHPLQIEPTAANEMRKRWADRGNQLIAMQSLLFNQPSLTLFQDSESRGNMGTYLKKIMDLAEKLGTSRLVFGSPKNRLVGNMSRSEAWDIAVSFFEEMGAYAQDKGLVFCIEPNPVVYGCDFITNTQEGIELVKAVNHPGFRLHLDTAAITLNHEQIPESITAAFPYLTHFHISEPYLQLIGKTPDTHHAAALTLNSLGYDGFVSIEMKAGLTESNVSSVRQALTYVHNCYSTI